jgi:hypothetical protein
VYLDPNAPAPDVQPTRPSSAVALGEVGSSLNDLVEAATSGDLRVDDLTGSATIQAIDTVREQLGTFRRLAANSASATRLGGGYAQLIDQFNREWSVSGDGSATEVMDRFDAELERLRDAVAMSMATYRASDESGERLVREAGGGQ